MVPQVLPAFAGISVFRWDINIRMATIIGLVGGGGVGTLLMQYQGMARWHEVGTVVIVIALVIIVIVMSSSSVSRGLRRAIIMIIIKEVE